MTVTCEPDDGDRRLTLATYNIHKCVGLDGRYDPDRTFRVLHEINADVLGLQEFDNRGKWRRPPLSVADFERATGLRAVSQPTISDDGGFHGNLVLSRYPIVEARQMDISSRWTEPRGVLIVDIAAAGEVLRVAVTHLGLWPAARRNQARRLLNVLTTPNGGPLVLMGDFNEWLPRIGCYADLTSRFGEHPAHPSFPARRPRVAFDRIWVEPRDRLRHIRVHATPLARAASDHLPVRAEIAI